MVLTKEQRIALKRVYDRGPVYTEAPIPAGFRTPTHIPPGTPLTYREFRRTAQQGWGCIMVRWQNMWLGIEEDGYTHS